MNSPLSYMIGVIPNLIRAACYFAKWLYSWVYCYSRYKHLHRRVNSLLLTEASRSLF